MTNPSTLDPAGKNLSKAHVTRLVKLCRTQVALERKILKLVTQAKTASKELEGVSRTDIPNLMTEMGVTELKLSDKAAVTITDWLNCKDTEKGRKWLAKHGHASIIKDTVTTLFDKGDHTKAVTLFKQLAKKGLVVEQKESVHNSTLKATLKKLIKGGRSVPLELFEATQGLQSKITLPKGGSA